MVRGGQNSQKANHTHTHTTYSVTFPDNTAQMMSPLSKLLTDLTYPTR